MLTISRIIITAVLLALPSLLHAAQDKLTLIGTIKFQKDGNFGITTD